MSYLTIHLISDLFLGYNEFSTEEEIVPDVDLVIINGNIGHAKRSMLYAERLCKKYPSTQFVYNLGETEWFKGGTCKSLNEFRDNMIKRRDYNLSWPKNLHYSYDSMIIECRNNKKIDILTLYGFPNIVKCETAWENTNWYKYHSKKVISDEDIPVNNIFKPAETSNVNHGIISIPADLEHVNEMYQSEFKKAQKWELTDTNCYKILVTHINPLIDSRCKGQKYTPYDIHMYEKNLWLTADTEVNGTKFLGCKLYSNPGRGIERRSKIYTIG